jgi:hypothetical protein
MGLLRIRLLIRGSGLSGCRPLLVAIDSKLVTAGVHFEYLASLLIPWVRLECRVVERRGRPET